MVFHKMTSMVWVVATIEPNRCSHKLWPRARHVNSRAAQEETWLNQSAEYSPAQHRRGPQQARAQHDQAGRFRNYLVRADYAFRE